MAFLRCTGDIGRFLMGWAETCVGSGDTVREIKAELIKVIQAIPNDLPQSPATTDWRRQISDAHARAAPDEFKPWS